ncbi:MAG: antibiotic biosynthesis monooxygenase family protein [Planctomycetota bacterium]
MYVAMNRFRVAPGREEAFLKTWRERESRLAGVPGFLRFRLLAGDGLFISYSEWRDGADFVAWTESPAFAKAHAQSRMPEGTLLGHPEFEGFEIALEQVPR